MNDNGYLITFFITQQQKFYMILNDLVCILKKLKFIYFGALSYINNIKLTQPWQLAIGNY